MRLASHDTGLVPAQAGILAGILEGEAGNT